MYCDSIFGPVMQWGFLVKDINEAMACWVDQLGVGPWWGFRNVAATSQFQGTMSDVKMDVGLAFQSGVQIELIQQTNDVLSPYSAFYETDAKQTLHQIAYFAKDIDAAVSRPQARGMAGSPEPIPSRSNGARRPRDIRRTDRERLRPNSAE